MLLSSWKAPLPMDTRFVAGARSMATSDAMPRKESLAIVSSPAPAVKDVIAVPRQVLFTEAIASGRTTSPVAARQHQNAWAPRDVSERGRPAPDRLQAMADRSWNALDPIVRRDVAGDRSRLVIAEQLRKQSFPIVRSPAPAVNDVMPV